MFFKNSQTNSKWKHFQKILEYSSFKVMNKLAKTALKLNFIIFNLLHLKMKISFSKKYFKLKCYFFL